MRANKLLSVIGLALAASLFGATTAQADEMAQATKFTFSQPIQIPGQVLPPGTYVFKLTGVHDPNVIQIFNADRTRIYATLETIRTERVKPGNTTIVLADPEDGGPATLLKWFYPGDTGGHEIVYPRPEEKLLAKSQQEPIAAQNPFQSPRPIGFRFRIY